VEYVSDDKGLEYVKFKVTTSTTYSYCNLVTKDLGADHSHSLTLSGVNLSWHD